ncbi:hypothetical protein BGZ99_003655 [Dissophora globulifera]|uniref:Uncharacterized protein n=1 Tax=Dissophora globulifera TaxID=979702 RepID=A0A9P6RTL9_9FUNG|nr:hypothetical protein BGZ99_003655 [Dissophora globulifera]
MKTKKWTEVLFKSSAQKPSTIETTCLDTVTPPYPQCSPTRPISASAPAKKKSIFNFGSRNSSTHSLLNLAFNSSTDNISPKISRINIANNNTRTSRKTKLDAASAASMAKEVSIETTTIYYHPPEPVMQTPVYAGQPQLIKNEQHYARGSSRNGYRNNAASSDQFTHIRDSDPTIRRSISYNSLSLHDHIHRPNYPNSSKERLPTPTAVLAARRKRAGSSPSTSVSNSATTLNTAYWQPPKLRPHEIASLPEQYVQYLQQQQQYGRLHQTPPVPIPSRDSRDSLRRHSSDTIMKLQASVRNMAQSRPSLEHEAVPFRRRSMTTDLLCPHNTPVVSGTIPILSGSSLQSADSKGGECSEMSYDELLRVVENLSGTVEVLSRKIGTMMNGSDITFFDSQLSTGLQRKHYASSSDDCHCNDNNDNNNDNNSSGGNNNLDRRPASPRVADRDQEASNHVHDQQQTQ